MAGIAALAKEAGIEVSGSDAQVYPPMSTLLESLEINLTEGYDNTDTLNGKTIVIGNALSRGNASVEYTLSNKLPFISGPQWLHENISGDKTVLAVAGTHGKTTTSAILAWILEAANKQPGFLIGGKPGNFEQSARIGSGEHFVIEADEYDTAFFDKRSKFVHYHPKVAVLNNLEFDHADIFPDLNAIKTQFHHLVRTVPENGRLIINADEPNLSDVINMGCWTPIDYFSIQDSNADWYAKANQPTAQHFTLTHKGKDYSVQWPGLGEHNMSNALAAVAAAYHAGINVSDACTALASFIFPNKRLQKHATKSGFDLYEDFAHHPTAVAKTLETLKKAHPNQRLIAVLELRSNTMQMGVHQDTLVPALMAADQAHVVNVSSSQIQHKQAHTQLIEHPHASGCFNAIKVEIKPNDVVLIMSNGAFDGIVQKLKER